MFAPIYLPPAPKPSDAVLAEERAILAAEGPFQVAGRFIRDAGLCDTARRDEAERRVAAAARAAHWLSRHACVWCGRPIAPESRYEIVSGEPLHARPCLVELDDFIREQDDRRAFEHAFEHAPEVRQTVERREAA